MAKRTVRGEIKSAFEDLKEGLGNAIDSAREALIDKGWFGQGSFPQGQTEWLRSDVEPGADTQSEPNLYGYQEDPRADWDNVRDAALSFYQDPQEQSEWEQTKERAEHFHEQDMEMDR